MNKQRRTVKTIIISAIVMLMSLSIFNIDSSAEQAPSCVSKKIVYVAKPEDSARPTQHFSTHIGANLYIKNLAQDAIIYDVKSSNKKVHAMNAYPTYFEGILIEGHDAKVGSKSKITFKVKQNGQVYSLECDVTVKYESSRYTKLKIGNTDYTKKIAGYSSKLIKPTGKPVKLSIKMKPGLKLDRIVLYSGGKITYPKNNSKVNLKSGDSLQIHYHYTKKPKNYSSYVGFSTSIYKYNRKHFYLHGVTGFLVIS